MAPLESCCTCATVIISDSSSSSSSSSSRSDTPAAAAAAAALSTKTEKQIPTAEDRRLGCCLRVICGRCIYRNPRFAEYCPYCQIATSPSNPLPSGLREPPSYDIATSTIKGGANRRGQQHPAEPPPPPYTPPPPTTTATTPNNNTTTLLNNNSEKHGLDDKPTPPPPDTLHFLHPTDDTIPSLSLRYRVPAAVLRAHNHLPSDHLLSARKTVLIPGSHYPAGVSLSPRPVDGEAEDARKAKIRRWMVACKCAEYDVAELYLEQAGYDLGAAVERFLADEEWERRNPLEARGKTTTKKGGAGTAKPGKGGTWASQAAFLRRQGPS